MSDNRDQPSTYAVPLTELKATAHVDPDDQVTEVDSTLPTPENPMWGHLPGNVRPYGV